jgi:formylmethanofuran dehydrogenase subunit B
MAAAAGEHLRRDVGCPFCGLACDDLVVARSANRLEIADNGCALSRSRLAEIQAADAASPLVDGQEADLAAAMARAASLLAASRAPVFVVASDVAGARAALSLAERTGGVIDHPDSDGLLASLGVVQDAGSLATTLSEVRSRADLVLVVGPDPAPAFPRFYERCVAPRRTLLDEKNPERVLLRLGSPDCASKLLPEALAALRSAVDDRPVATAGAGGLDAAGLRELAARLKSARYGVIVWAPSLLETRDVAPVGHALLGLVRDLTRTTRCTLLALGGAANLIGVNQVCVWQTGYPLRTSFATGVPEHDPWRHSARRMIVAGEADAVVWVSAFDNVRVPLTSSVPTILLAPPSAPPPGLAAYIPVGVPGLDHAGQIFRSDGVVALPVRALRQSALPDVATVLGRIETALAAREPAP